MSRILLDCDGVLANFTEHMCDHIGRHCSRPDPTGFIEWDFLKHHLNDEQRAVVDVILKGHEFWYTQPIIPGAKRAVDRFLDAGHDVHIVTTPWRSCYGWIDVREAWIKHHLGIGHSNVHGTSSKYLYSGAVFVDDKFEHIDAWHKEQVLAEQRPDRVAFLFSYPYNAGINWSTRIKDWSDEAAIATILHRAAQAGPAKQATNSDEFERGYDDGRGSKPCTDSSLSYLNGFLQGREFRSIARIEDAP